ncbi:unnamed protein product [Ixodes pacificus]
MLSVLALQGLGGCLFRLDVERRPPLGVARGRSTSLPSASVEKALHGARATPGSIHGSHGSRSCGSFHARRITTALSSVPLRTDASFHHDVVGLGRKISRPLCRTTQGVTVRVLAYAPQMLHKNILVIWFVWKFLNKMHEMAALRRLYASGRQTLPRRLRLGGIRILTGTNKLQHPFKYLRSFV